MKFKLQKIISTPIGYCQCGCGQKTKIITRTYSAIGWKKGEFKKWIRGHHLKLKNGKKSNNWKGGKHKDSCGYIRISNNHSHPKNDGYGRVKEHVLIVERVLGKSIPINSIIHHVDENRANNKNDNLVLCQDKKYHRLIHTRLNAFKNCGNANWKKCWICKQYDDLKNLEVIKRNTQHKKCRQEYMKKYMKKYNK